MVTKLLKWLFRIIVGLILITLLATIGIVNFVNPNRFKGLIEQEALTLTGHTLRIQGPLSWQWYPLLSLQLEDVSLETPPPLNAKLMSAKTIKAECSPASLLFGKLFINLKLKEAILNLQINTTGQTNWDTLKTHLSNSKNNHENTNAANKQILNNIYIEDGSLIFEDSQKNTHYRLSHINITANSLLQSIIGTSPSFSVQFDLDSSKKSLGKFALTGNMALKPALNQMHIQNIALSHTAKNGNNSAIKGEATISDLSKNPSVRGKLETNKIDINAWLKLFDIAPNEFIPPAVSLKTSFSTLGSELTISALQIDLLKNGTLEGDMTVNLANPALRALKLQGNFLGKALQFNKIKIDTISGNVLVKNGILTVDPITLHIANSLQKASVQINFQGTVPKYSLTHQADNFEINDLLTLFDKKDKLAGKTSIKLKLTATGNTQQEWQQSLTGDAQFEIANGKYYGIDLMALVKMAQSQVHSLVNAFTHKQSLDTNTILNTEEAKWKPSPTAYTPFTLAKGTATIMNGLVKNPDFSMVHTDYAITGQGTYNLNNERIDYQTSVLLKNNPDLKNDQIAQFLAQTPLVVNIQGSLDSPSIKPDIKDYTNRAMNYAKTHLMEKVIEQSIHKALDQLLKHAH